MQENDNYAVVSQILKQGAAPKSPLLPCLTPEALAAKNAAKKAAKKRKVPAQPTLPALYPEEDKAAKTARQLAFEREVLCAVAINPEVWAATHLLRGAGPLANQLKTAHNEDRLTIAGEALEYSRAKEKSKRNAVVAKGNPTMRDTCF
jgi:hypothetical protein